VCVFVCVVVCGGRITISSQGCYCCGVIELIELVLLVRIVLPPRSRIVLPPPPPLSPPLPPPLFLPCCTALRLRLWVPPRWFFVIIVFVFFLGMYRLLVRWISRRCLLCGGVCWVFVRQYLYFCTSKASQYLYFFTRKASGLLWGGVCWVFVLSFRASLVQKYKSSTNTAICHLQTRLAVVWRAVACACISCGQYLYFCASKASRHLYIFYE
jgi:hypothetical protein